MKDVKASILIVEDEESVRTSFAEVLPISDTAHGPRRTASLH
jgi:hypothetical protein